MKSRLENVLDYVYCYENLPAIRPFFILGGVAQEEISKEWMKRGLPAPQDGEADRYVCLTKYDHISGKKPMWESARDMQGMCLSLRYVL